MEDEVPNVSLRTEREQIAKFFQKFIEEAEGKGKDAESIAIATKQWFFFDGADAATSYHQKLRRYLKQMHMLNAHLQRILEEEFFTEEIVQYFRECRERLHPQANVDYQSNTQQTSTF